MWLMPEDEKVISDLIFWTGLHRVEVIRFGRPVDEDAAAKTLVPDVSQESVTMFDWIEDPEGLKLYHLYVNWKERGAVDFSKIKDCPIRYGILWYIDKGESISFSADVAATVHKRSFGCMPSASWVRRLPAKAQTVIEVGEGDDHMMLELRTGDWVPERFVVVGNPG
jgi:hypothetical protein